MKNQNGGLVQMIFLYQSGNFLGSSHSFCWGVPLTKTAPALFGTGNGGVLGGRDSY